MIQVVIDRQIVNSELKGFLKEHNIRFKETEVETNFCPVCNKEFIVRAVGTINERKFCSYTCASRWRARIRYEFEKDNPQYKQKKKEYFEKWRIENREHFNDLLREPNRIKAYENYHKFDELGMCVSCGRKRDNNTKTCNHCSNIRKDSENKIKLEKL